MCLEYEAVKRAYNRLREMNAEFAEGLRQDVRAIVGLAKRRGFFAAPGNGTPLKDLPPPPQK